MGFSWVLDFAPLAGTGGGAVAAWDPLPTDLGLKKMWGGKGQPGCSQDVPSMGLWLCPASPAAPDPPWQSGVTPAAHQRIHFVPVPLNPPSKFTALSESSPFIQQWTFVPAALAPPAPGCVYSSANASKVRCSFFWPCLLTKATVFMEWGYVKEQSPSTELPLLQPRSRGESASSAEHRANFTFPICSSQG